MDQGYPALSDIVTYIAAEGVEEIAEGNTNFRQEFMQFLWSLLNRNSWAGGLGVYAASTTTFNVRGGSYLYKGTPKTYTPGSAVNPTDNDTTYIWMKPDNTIDSAIDGTGWPTTEHIKLASIVVDADGNITSITDLRGQAFAADVGSYVVEAGTSVQVLPSHWDSPSPADDDEIHIPFYAENDADEKIEYARLVIKLADVSDGTEDAEVSLMVMVAGTLTDIGNLVGISAAQTLTNKTLTTPVITRTIEAHTAGDTLTAAESGSIHTNLNATGAITLTLPASAAAGIEFHFAVQTTQELRIDPGTATIRDDSGQTASKYKSADAIGECITLVSDSNGDWVTVAKHGTWTEEA